MNASRNFESRREIYPSLAEVLQIQDWICFNQGSKAKGTGAFCVVLPKTLYPCRNSDMVPRFARAVPVLSMVGNQRSARLHLCSP